MISCVRAFSRTTRTANIPTRAAFNIKRAGSSMSASASASGASWCSTGLLQRRDHLDPNPTDPIVISADCPVSHILEGLGNFREEPLQGQSAFVKPMSLLFDQAGKQRRWDAVQAHPSVAVVLYHTQLESFVIVRQFRPAVYAVRWRSAKAAGQPPPSPAAGLSYELCAGIIDKPGKTVQQITCEEILEEVGYQVNPDQLVCCAGSVISSAGITGSPQTMYFAQLDESMRASPGGGTMAVKERVEALSLPLSALDGFIVDDSIAKTPGLCFGLLWGKQWLQQQQAPRQ